MRTWSMRGGCFALCCAALVGCGSPGSNQDAGPQQVALSVTATPASIVGDGTSTSAITVAHPDSTATAEVTFSTARGTFRESGANTYKVALAAGAATATLISCDSRASGGCTGATRVSATTAEPGVGATTVTFTQAEVCNNNIDDNNDSVVDCADPGCGGLTCKLTGATQVGAGACVGTACLCAVDGGVPEAAEQTCDDGKDNDCDVAVDCSDTGCLNRPCMLLSGVRGLCDAAKTCKCPGTVENTNALCSDGVDNDCDGRTDCNDPDCQSRSGQLGKVCDAQNHTCTAPDSSGNATCTFCPGGQTAESTCGDSQDNDCDGVIDCEDSDCASAVCGGNGRVCDGTAKLCVCSGNGGTAEATEATCGDGFDNDCDGTVDCADTNCRPSTSQQAAVCGANGLRCTAAGACTCSGNGGTVQTAEQNCADGADNDCDGLQDCSEAYCQPQGNNPGQVCNTLGRSLPNTVGALTCSSLIAGPSTCTVCTVPSGISETAEGDTVGGATVTCGDGKDNDCDGVLDCQDPSCTGKACDTLGKACTSTGQCLCTASGGPETNCADNLDNDCDGQKDCADSDCRVLSGGLYPVCAANGFRCTAGGTCACTGNGGTAQANETNCSDGFDNDCDGLADCADGTGAAHCQPVGNALGGLCDVRGNTCSVPGTGGSTCTVCSGNGGTREQGAEATCGDAKDNDCDGIIDCQDSSCQGRACTANGMTCNAGLTCTCPGGTTETDCGNNFDDDCDGLKDCADPDCRPSVGPMPACGANGLRCTAGGTCTCSGNGGTSQASETACGDGFDNDCDGYVDCLDVSCRATPPNFNNGLSCADPSAAPPRVGNVCDGAGQCICPGGQTSETSCRDNLDNDCDGLVDCNDPNCAGQSCNAFGRTCPSSPGACGVCSGNGGTAQTQETTCNDGFDNDCDGAIDCADSDCANQQCGGSSNYQCQSNVCKDTTSTYSLVVVATPNKLAANGTSTSTVTATLRDGATPLGNRSVTFSVSSGQGSVNPTATTTNPTTGVATTVFTSSANGGPATVQVAYDTGTQIITGTVVIQQPPLNDLTLVRQEYTIMGVRGSGYNESNQFTFQLTDGISSPYPPGLTVNFTHTSLGGSYLGATPNCSGNTCTASAVTDAAGQVKVDLHSGTLAGVVAITAAATAGGIPVNLTVSNIAIVGARASGLNISLICTPRNIPGYTVHDCSKSLYAGQDDRASCVAYFADRFGNVLGRSTLATFTSEAGAASAPSFTNSTGQASGTVYVTGYPLPADVAAQTGEPSLTYVDTCGTKTHNPRDGISTVIVSVVGEEGFVDGSNGRPANGVYDVGENFLDMGEPFVDYNDNNVRDFDEPYLDVNTSGSWNGPNGQWDADTTIWATTRVNYTGYPAAAANLAGENVLARWLNNSAIGLLPGPTPPATPFNLQVGQNPAASTTRAVYFTDENMNPISHRATYSLDVAPAGAVTAVYSPAFGPFIDSLAADFTVSYCADALGTMACGSACLANPCYRVERVSNFGTGRLGNVLITASNANPNASIEVRAKCTLGTVTSATSLYGATFP